MAFCGSAKSVLAFKERGRPWLRINQSSIQGPDKKAVLFGGPYNKDSRMLGSMLGSGKLPYCVDCLELRAWPQQFIGCKGLENLGKSVVLVVEDHPQFSCTPTYRERFEADACIFCVWRQVAIV